MTRKRNCFDSAVAGVRGVHAPGRRRAQEHPGLRSDGIRQNDLDQGADSGDPGRGAPRSRSRMLRNSSSIRIPNHVRLFYSKDDQGLARVTPKQLLESCLRMKPDRILLAELRAEEAFDYLRNVNSGHPGSITSIHAGSCELAFEQLVLLVKQSAGGRELARARHQEPSVSAGRCRHPVRRRAPGAIHQGDLV